MEKKTADNSKLIWRMLLYFSVAFIIGALCAGDWSNLIPGFITICTRPSQFTMDYFVLGGLGSAFLNTGLVGLACCGLLYFTKAKCTGLTVAAFWLNVGFATFGMNFFNIWPFFFGTWVYSRIKKVPFGSVANLAMFSTALAPFASELTFRYPNLETSGFSVVGLILTILFGILVGCVMPSLCAHAQITGNRSSDQYQSGRRRASVRIGIFPDRVWTLSPDRMENGQKLFQRLQKAFEELRTQSRFYR